MQNFLRKMMFNIWYFFNPPWDTGVSPPELLAYLDEHPPGRALDLGCGTGTNLITMAKRGWEVVGVDFAAAAIAAARRKARRADVNVELHVADASRLKDVEGPFNLILDMGCFHSIPEERRPDYITNLPRLLADNGSYLLYAFTLEENEQGRGISNAEIQLMETYLNLDDRADGSERGRRSSAWFTFSSPEAA